VDGGSEVTHEMARQKATKSSSIDFTGDKFVGRRIKRVDQKNLLESFTLSLYDRAKRETKFVGRRI
jgi:hypothetical protein